MTVELAATLTVPVVDVFLAIIPPLPPTITSFVLTVMLFPLPIASIAIPAASLAVTLPVVIATLPVPAVMALIAVPEPEKVASPLMFIDTLWFPLPLEFACINPNALDVPVIAAPLAACVKLIPPSPSKLNAINADTFTLALASKVATMFIPGSTIMFSEFAIVPEHTKVPVVLESSSQSKFPSADFNWNTLFVASKLMRNILAPNLGVVLNTTAPALTVPVTVTIAMSSVKSVALDGVMSLIVMAC